MYVCECV